MDNNSPESIEEGAISSEEVVEQVTVVNAGDELALIAEIAGIDDVQPTLSLQELKERAMATKQEMETRQADEGNVDPSEDKQEPENESEESSDSESSSSSDSEPPHKMTLEEREKELQELDDLEEDQPSNQAIRSKNEIVELPPVEPLPISIVPPEGKIEPVGKIHNIVEQFVIVEATTDGEYQVLDVDSVLCLADRTVLGRVFDTFGPVSKPMYSIRFNDASSIDRQVIQIGKDVCYVPDYANFVFTQPLKAQKGSDASNMFDEEPSEAELEFSDDEQEAEHKRKLKAKKRGDEEPKPKRGRGRGGNRGSSRGGHGRGYYPFGAPTPEYDPQQAYAQHQQYVQYYQQASGSTDQNLQNILGAMYQGQNPQYQGQYLQYQGQNSQYQGQYPQYQGQYGYQQYQDYPPPQ